MLASLNLGHNVLFTGRHASLRLILEFHGAFCNLLTILINDLQRRHNFLNIITLHTFAISNDSLPLYLLLGELPSCARLHIDIIRHLVS